MSASGFGARFSCWRWALGLGWRSLPMPFTSERLQRRHRLQHALARQEHDRLSSFSQLGAEMEGTIMELDEILHDGQAEAGSALCGLVGK